MMMMMMMITIIMFHRLFVIFFPAVVAVTAAHVACVRHSSARAGQREERRPARHGSHTQLPQAAQPASSL